MGREACGGRWLDEAGPVRVLVAEGKPPFLVSWLWQMRHGYSSSHPPVQIQKFKMALFHAKSDWCGPPIRLYGFLSRPQVHGLSHCAT